MKKKAKVVPMLKQENLWGIKLYIHYAFSHSQHFGSTRQQLYRWDSPDRKKSRPQSLSGHCDQKTSTAASNRIPLSNL